MACLFPYVLFKFKKNYCHKETVINALSSKHFGFQCQRNVMYLKTRIMWQLHSIQSFLEVQQL